MRADSIKERAATACRPYSSNQSRHFPGGAR